MMNWRFIRNQRGTTLLETLVVLAVSSLFVVAFASISYTMVRISANSSARVTASTTVEEALRAISEDGQRAQNTSLVHGGAAVGSVTLSWINPVNGEFHQVTYSLSGNNLRRAESVNAVLQSERTVARNLTSVAFSQPADQGYIFKVNLTSSAGSPAVNETREYYVSLRPLD